MSEARLIKEKIARPKKVLIGSSISKLILESVLKRLPKGTLSVHDDGDYAVFGTGTEIEAMIEVYDQRFYTAIVSQGSIGAGEAFIEGWWDSSDVTKVIELFALNTPFLDKIEAITHIFQWPQKLITRIRDKNIMAHYDLGNELYKRFLDPTMLYSSAIFESSEQSLHDASINKMKVICERLDLKPGEKVLEIGTGWGALACYIAENYDCEVVTTTISEEQHAYTEELIRSKNLSDKVCLLKTDYRELIGSFDKVVSIEMIEAVGHEYFPSYFKKVNDLLKPGGIALIQSILIEHDRYEQYKTNVDFIQKYIFPGGALPSKEVIQSLCFDHTDLTIKDISLFGKDYAKTLREWRKSFNINWEQIKPFGYDEKFKRLWNFYFHYCEGGFEQKQINVGHFCLVKAG